MAPSLPQLFARSRSNSAKKTFAAIFERDPDSAHEPFLAALRGDQELYSEALIVFRQSQDRHDQDTQRNEHRLPLPTSNPTF